MKKILIVISFVFLCGTYSAAQDRRLTQQEFERLVDYANTQLLRTFIDAHRSRLTNLQPTYDSLRQVNLCDIPDFDRIIGWIPSDRSATLRLADSVNLIKQNWNRNRTVDQLIDIISVESHGDVNLVRTSERVRKEIRAYLRLPTEKTSIQQLTVVPENNGQADEPQIQLSRLKQLFADNTLIFTIITSVVLTLLILIFLFVVFKKKIKKWIDVPMPLSQEEIEEKIKELLEQEIDRLKKERNPDINDDVINTIADKVREHLQLDERGENEAPQPQTSNNNVKYPSPIVGSSSTAAFPNNLSDTQGDSYFRFFDIKGNTAKFEFCGTNIDKAKSNRDELKGACEISGYTDGAKVIKNEEAGIVTLRNERWEIGKKAKIRFE